MSKTVIYKQLSYLLAIITIITTGVVLTNGLSNTLDIFFLDETGYLVRGTKMFDKIPKRWGPFYCFWYRILYIFESDLVKLFYLNFKIMTIVPALAIFVMISRYSKVIVINLFFALCYLVSVYNLPVYPKVSAFCLTIICMTVWGSSFFNKTFYKGLIFAFAALIMSYARPEFFLAFVIIIILLVLLVLFKKASFGKKELGFSTAFIACFVLLHLGLGNPMTIEMYGMNRSMVAFGEHFAFNYTNWNKSDLFLWLNWEDLFKEYFDDSDSFFQVLQHNPKMFFKHIFSNVLFFLTSLGNMFAGLFIPLELPKTLGAIIGWLGLASVIAYSVFQRLFKITFEMILLVLLAIPSLIAQILIFPRHHYIIFLIPLLLILLTLPLKKIKPFTPKVTIGITIILAGLFFMLNRNAEEYTFFMYRKDQGVLNNQKALKLFNEASFDKPIVFLTHDGDFSEFTNKEFQLADHHNKKNLDFDTFLTSTDPDIIYCTKTLLKNPNFANDEQWQYFLLNYEDYNYMKIPFGDNIKEYFLVKKSIYPSFDLD